jgi:two-component system cell cycle response regulator
MKILIAEDNLISLKMLEKTLVDWRYSVYKAPDGEKAWQLLHKHKVRIVILDWMMPGLNGIELCKKIRKSRNDRYTYIILLTSKDDSTDVIEGLMAGADDYITKPFNPQELKARLQTGRRIIRLEAQLLITQRRLHEMATKDGLTRILNREAILQTLDDEHSRSHREKSTYSAIMVDIDNFKLINDTHGHQIGDKVIFEVACRLKKNLRRYDKIGRYGGDEILIVLPSCSSEELEWIARRLCNAVNTETVETTKGPVCVTISLGGISSADIEQPSSQQILIESDAALYKAKRMGRSRFAVVTRNKIGEGINYGPQTN